MENSVHTVLFLPDNIEAVSGTDELVAHAAAAAGVNILRPCGGAGTCGKCRVSATDGRRFLSPLTATEKKLLKKEEINSGVRLACCAKILGSGTLKVIDAAEEQGSRILEGTSVKPVTEWSPDKKGLGVAVDLGTTTVVCYLLDLDRHKVAGIRSFLNPQVSYGDDVVSRIAASTLQPGALARMQEMLVEEMNKAFSTLAEKAGTVPESLNEAVVAGNTVMEHIFLGISPESIGCSPYSPQFRTHPPVAASDLGLKMSPNGTVKVIPVVSGYVGGDIVAGIAAHDVDREVPLRLFIDIGTNNEIVIGNKEKMYCCATAAGPAFEGAGISQGISGCSGAVEKVSMTEDGISYKVIGGVAPKGLCGSGLIDAVAILLREGVIDGGGRMLTREECTDERIKDRLSLDDYRINRFLITDRNDPVYLTQKDVRAVQLATGAVKAGTEVLMEKMGVAADGIDEVLLAGAFGSNIDISNAMTGGLIPKVERERVRFVFNSSGLGACMAQASEDFYRRTEQTMGGMEYIELSSLQDFQDRFIRSLTFA